MTQSHLFMEDLSKDSLLKFLESCPSAKSFVLAVSGGLDSATMLFLFYQSRKCLQQRIEVVYIDHKLQHESQRWGEFVAGLASRYSFNFHLLEATGSPRNGGGIENWAREQRYKLLRNRMSEDGILFTAHHLDDQIETFFLQAFRGSGPRGLSGMPVIRPFAEGHHARPLLSFSRQQLELFAKEYELEWIDDPSNIDTSFDRNYLRKKIFPLVELRWPSYRKTLCRLTKHQTETRIMLDEMASQDLSLLLDKQGYSIDLEGLRALSRARQKNVFLYWARMRQLATPGNKHLQQIFSSVLTASVDSSPCVNWADVELRRYRNRLYLLKLSTPHYSNSRLIWNIRDELQIGDEALKARPVAGTGIAGEYLLNGSVSVRFRQGGERIRPFQKGCSKTIKQLFREAGVLPWWRDRFPLVFIDGELAAVPGIGIDEQFIREANHRAFEICWTGFNKSIAINV